jgi:hypothetical protein
MRVSDCQLQACDFGRGPAAILEEPVPHHAKRDILAAGVGLQAF